MGSAAAIDTLLNVDVNNRRSHAIGGAHDGARIFVEQRGIIGRRGQTRSFKSRPRARLVQQNRDRMLGLTWESGSCHELNFDLESLRVNYTSNQIIQLI